MKNEEREASFNRDTVVEIEGFRGKVSEPVNTAFEEYPSAGGAAENLISTIHDRRLCQSQISRCGGGERGCKRPKASGIRLESLDDR